MTECPKCFLPKDDGAWHCDGCGYQFSQDIDGVRTTLEAQVRTSHITFWVTLGVGVAVIGGLVYLATIGFIYVSVAIILAVLGSIGHAVHKRSVMREHLQSFERRYPQLPKATVRTP